MRMVGGLYLIILCMDCNFTNFGFNCTNSEKTLSFKVQKGVFQFCDLVRTFLLISAHRCSSNPIDMPRASGRATKKASYAESGSEGSDSESEAVVGDTVSSEDDASVVSSSDEAPKKKAKKESPKKSKSPAKAASASNGAKKSPAKGKAAAPAPRASGPAASRASTAAPSSSSSSAIPAGPLGMDITQGGPVTTDAAAKRLVLQYMRQQNRPYSVQQVLDNLHKRVPKGTLERVMGALVASGEGLLSKDYGKARIFFPDQGQLLGSGGTGTGEQAEASGATLEGLAEDNDALREQVKELVARERALRAELSRLAAEPTDVELPALLQQMESSREEKQARLQGLLEQGQGADANPNALRDAIRQFNGMREGWFRRRGLCMDALDLLAEGMDRKRSELLEELGLETDEDAGVKLPNVLKEPIIPLGQQGQKGQQGGSRR